MSFYVLFVWLLVSHEREVWRMRSESVRVGVILHGEVGPWLGSGGAPLLLVRVGFSAAGAYSRRGWSRGCGMCIQAEACDITWLWGCMVSYPSMKGGACIKQQEEDRARCNEVLAHERPLNHLLSKSAAPYLARPTEIMVRHLRLGAISRSGLLFPYSSRSALLSCLPVRCCTKAMV